MTRLAMGVIVGLLVGQLIAAVIWWWGFYLYAPSPLVDMNPTLARTNFGLLPVAALLCQIAGQGIGAFIGGRVALAVSREGPQTAWAVGGGFGLIAILWLFVHPRPIWFAVLEIVVIGAAAWGAGRLVQGYFDRLSQGDWRGGAEPPHVVAEAVEAEAEPYSGDPGAA